MKKYLWQIISGILFVTLLICLIGIYLLNQDLSSLRSELDSARRRAIQNRDLYLEYAVSLQNCNAELEVAENTISKFQDEVEQDPERIDGVECDAGECSLAMPLENNLMVGYSVDFYSDWSVHVSGVEGTNLLFNEFEQEGSKQTLLIQLTMSDLPFEEVYNAVYSYEQVSEPLIPDTENVITTFEMDMLGKRVLRVTTDNDEKIRYFLTQLNENGQTVFMFEGTFTDGTYTASQREGFIQDVEEMIAYMQFI